MFKMSNVLKKSSIVIAGLALIVPLASFNGANVNARHVHRHARAVRVMKHHRRNHHNRRARRHVAKKHLQIGAASSYDMKVNAALNYESKNYAYDQGFNDALHANVNHKLVHNSNYERGYEQIIALDNYTAPNGKQVPKHLSNDALKSAKVYYNYCVLK